MKMPTRQAPHICDHVLVQASLSWLPFTRSSSAEMIHDTRMAVPATKGVQLKAAVMVAPGVMDDDASTESFSPLIFGRSDHGPVQAMTTTTSTRMGIHPCQISLPARPWPSTAAAPETGTPP